MRYSVDAEISREDLEELEELIGASTVLIPREEHRRSTVMATSPTGSGGVGAEASPR